MISSHSSGTTTLILKQQFTQYKITGNLYMHRWRLNKIGILMDFSYQWCSSQWVLVFRTAKQTKKALLLKKQRIE